jgi:hypothetical protein
MNLQPFSQRLGNPVHIRLKYFWGVKKKRPCTIDHVRKRLLFISNQNRLDGPDVYCRRAFRTLLNIKAHALAFLQRLEAAGLNCAEMYEHVTAIRLFDEAEAFAFVEPLYFTF